jgi:hypothetical protein
MGYYPPYIPDSYLQAVKYIPNSYEPIKKVEPVTKKDIDSHRLDKNMEISQKPQDQEGKGFFFDQYA